MDHGKPVKAAATMSFTDMKKSQSVLDFEELLTLTEVDQKVGDEFPSHKPLDDVSVLTAESSAAANHTTFPFRNQEIMNNFPSCTGLTDTLLWSPNITSKQSSMSTPIDSQSSICVSSPNSATKPKGRYSQATGTTSGSSGEQSDDDDMETEAGQCEQSTDPLNVKRMKRMVSNRESARRSRSRKQAHLVELEQQVDQLRGENATLFKQLTDATQQFKDSTTNNRVLKSDVEALRAKVKLAEDMVARGSLTSTFSHLLQNHLSTPQSFGSHNMCRLGNVSPTINVEGDDVSFPGMMQNSTLGVQNADAFSGSVNNGVINDTVSCVSDNWAWDSHLPTMSK
ncbi:basic leucine zipper 9 [Rhododendron vialii]|uniref:basic leucine zipper 9 n=1 Tax=Rhododendron vialii TaxID=182163 RepID=UPI00265FD69C|nr:basic leucine zipper 9 [Rhododendron vialii]